MCFFTKQQQVRHEKGKMGLQDENNSPTEMFL